MCWSWPAGSMGVDLGTVVGEEGDGGGLYRMIISVLVNQKLLENVTDTCFGDRFSAATSQDRITHFGLTPTFAKQFQTNIV